jgi:hypothetical protein
VLPQTRSRGGPPLDTIVTDDRVLLERHATEQSAGRRYDPRWRDARAKYSRARIMAGLSGFLILSQCRDYPDLDVLTGIFQKPRASADNTEFLVVDEIESKLEIVTILTKLSGSIAGRRYHHTSRMEWAFVPGPSLTSRSAGFPVQSAPFATCGLSHSVGCDSK